MQMVGPTHIVGPVFSLITEHDGGEGMKSLSDEEFEEQNLYFARWGREGKSITKCF